MKVFVYYNLASQCWSIKALTGEHKGKVIGHASSVLLSLVKFKVNEKGRQRVLQEKRKNVHAGAVGILHSANLLLTTQKSIRARWRCVPAETDKCRVRIARCLLGTTVSYNPYKAGFFFATATGERVDCGSWAFLSPGGVVHTKYCSQYTNSELETNLAYA